MRQTEVLGRKRPVFAMLCKHDSCLRNRLTCANGLLRAKSGARCFVGGIHPFSGHCSSPRQGQLTHCCSRKLPRTDTNVSSHTALQVSTHPSADIIPVAWRGRVDQTQPTQGHTPVTWPGQEPGPAHPPAFPPPPQEPSRASWQRVE